MSTDDHHIVFDPLSCNAIVGARRGALCVRRLKVTRINRSIACERGNDTLRRPKVWQMRGQCHYLHQSRLRWAFSGLVKMICGLRSIHFHDSLSLTCMDDRYHCDLTISRYVLRLLLKSCLYLPICSFSVLACYIPLFCVHKAHFVRLLLFLNFPFLLIFSKNGWDRGY